jgi:hypothetical protein
LRACFCPSRELPAKLHMKFTLPSRAECDCES